MLNEDLRTRGDFGPARDRRPGRPPTNRGWEGTRSTMVRRVAIDRFYEILDDNIARRGRHDLGSLSRSGSLYSNPELNRPGIYFIFEPDEFREDGVTPRIVYIGITKTERLFTRLEQHSREKDQSNLAWYVSEALCTKHGKTEFIEPLSKPWPEIPDELYREMRAFQLEGV